MTGEVEVSGGSVERRKRGPGRTPGGTQRLVAPPVGRVDGRRGRRVGAAVRPAVPARGRRRVEVRHLQHATKPSMRLTLAPSTQRTPLNLQTESKA